MKKYISLATWLFLVTVVLAAGAVKEGWVRQANAAGAVSQHISVLVLQQEGNTDELAFPIQGNDREMLIDSQAQGHVLLLSHSASINHNVIISIANDVLSLGGGGDLEDVGIDCQLNVHPMVGSAVIAGKCEFNVLDRVGKPHHTSLMIETSEVFDDGTWMLLFYDEVTGIAVYAKVEG